jgi:hypothetical protein
MEYCGLSVSQKALGTLSLVALNVCGSSIWNLCYVVLLAPRIMSWPLDFWKICIIPFYNIW